MKTLGSSLGIKATLFALALSTIPVAVVGYIGYQISGGLVEQQVETTQQNNAEQIATQLSRFMFERFGDIQVLSEVALITDPELRQVVGQQGVEQFLDTYLRSYGEIYDSIEVLDINGYGFAVAGEDTYSEARDESDYFQAAREGSIYIGRPEFSTTTGTVVVYTSAPIYNAETGDLFGIVRTRTPVQVIIDQVEGVESSGIHFADDLGLIFASTEEEEEEEEEEEAGAETASSSGTGESQESLLEDPEADAEDPDAEESEEAGPEEPDAEEAGSEELAGGRFGLSIDELFPDLAAARAANPSGFIETIEVFDQEEELLGFARTSVIGDMPDLAWTVLVETEADEAYRAATELGSTFVFGTLLTIIIAGILASLIAQSALRPLQSATEAVERIGQGDLDVRLPVESRDELGILATNINLMAAQLQRVLADVQNQSEQLQQKNDQIEHESSLLQHDVGHLLDVISAVEEGDLTVKAEVGEGATGLVADTLNRLIEELNRILGTTVNTASQVTLNASELELLASQTAQQAQQQTDSVQQVRYLMEAVNQQATTATQQVEITQAAVTSTEQAVAQGQEQILSMTTGIGSLQDGSEQIVRRVKTLNDYIGLAAQFSKEQKRIAALTRVLALNASTLAARALGQEDPDQFASIAREFETIASQVNDLALQTNQGLQILQQRTDQIQTVVSGLNQDVDDITQLVRDFTQGTEQSRQAFNNIRTVTQQVSNLGRQMTESSLAIAAAAETTLRAVQDIANTASDTEGQARFTREQAAAMQSLARQLLTVVQFFRLSLDGQSTPLSRSGSYTNGSLPAERQEAPLIPALR